METQPKYVALLESSLAWVSQVTLIQLLNFLVHYNHINFQRRPGVNLTFESVLEERIYQVL